MATKKTLGTDARGVYRRYIGWKVSDGKIVQHLFRLGRDECEAKVANMRLESLWDAVVARWHRLTAENKTDGPDPRWDATTLAIAQAIAKGESTCYVLPPPEVSSLPVEMQVAWLGRLQADLPVIPLRLAELDVFTRGVDGIRAVIEIKKGILTTLKEPVCTKTLHQALDAYADYIAKKYEAKPSNRSQQMCIRLLKKHGEKKLTLDRLDSDRIEILLAYWCKRPVGQAGQPLAFTTCRNVLIVLRQFLRWLNRSPQFDWNLQNAFSFPRCKIARTNADRIKKRMHFKIAELRTIWQYAKPWDRALILLALNCGFSKAEIATLQIGEVVVIEKKNGDNGGDKKERKKRVYIKRHRTKTDVYGEWLLWPETVEALEYLKQYRPQGSQHVVLNHVGNRLTRKTPKDNENQVIKNHWDHIFERIQADRILAGEPAFYKLPFKHLRKTGATRLRHLKIENAAELSSMYLAHGEASDHKDQLLPVYASRPWKKLHRALILLRRKLLPVISSVKQPWEETGTRATPLTVAKIKELHRQGKSTEEVAKEIGLHSQTVRKILQQDESVA